MSIHTSWTVYVVVPKNGATAELRVFDYESPANQYADGVKGGADVVSRVVRRKQR